MKQRSFFTLATEILSKLDRGGSYDRGVSHSRGNIPTPQAGNRAYKPWRFENSDNK